MKRIAMLFAALLAYGGLAFGAVNINSATKEQLESLDGIGPVRAQAIIDYRKKNGSFKSLEDLKKVDGVGDVNFDKIRKDIALTGTTTMPKSDSASKAAPKAESMKASAADKKADAMKDMKKVDDKKDMKKADDKKDMNTAADKKAADKKAADKKADAMKDAKKDDDKKK